MCLDTLNSTAPVHPQCARWTAHGPFDTCAQTARVQLWQSQPPWQRLSPAVTANRNRLSPVVRSNTSVSTPVSQASASRYAYHVDGRFECARSDPSTRTWWLACHPQVRQRRRQAPGAATTTAPRSHVRHTASSRATRHRSLAYGTVVLCVCARVPEGSLPSLCAAAVAALEILSSFQMLN